MASFWARDGHGFGSWLGGPDAKGSSVRARSRDQLGRARPTAGRWLAELLQALDLVRFQRRVHRLAPVLEALEVFRVELLGHLVGVVGHAGVGQQEVVDLVGLARWALAGRAGAGLLHARRAWCPSSTGWRRRPHVARRSGCCRQRAGSRTRARGRPWAAGHAPRARHRWR